MFDFEKLDVYQRVKTYHLSIRKLLKDSAADKYVKDQLIRASMSIMLNIAEGSGRFSKADKRNFYVIARSSLFECVALLEILLHDTIIREPEYQKFYAESEEISKILYALIVRLQSEKLK
jgi:four helix bundle protein